MAEASSTGLKPPVPVVRRRSFRFAGHRRSSFTTSDVDELTELRARQRTADGAYLRTALGNLTYALVVLKLFSRDFAKIGIAYLALSAVLMLISTLRQSRDLADFSDGNVIETLRGRWLATDSASATVMLPAKMTGTVTIQSVVDEDHTHTVDGMSLQEAGPSLRNRASESTHDNVNTNANANETANETQAMRSEVQLPPASKRHWGRRRFRTGGGFVIVLAVCVLVMEVALFWLVIKLPA